MEAKGGEDLSICYFMAHYWSSLQCAIVSLLPHKVGCRRKGGERERRKGGRKEENLLFVEGITHVSDSSRCFSYISH